MNAAFVWIVIAVAAGSWFFGKSAGYSDGHKDGLNEAPAHFAAKEADKRRSEETQKELELARVAVQPSMMMCLDILGVDISGIEEEIREDMIEDSMTEYDLRSEPY